MIDFAKKYLEHGFSVFPVHPATDPVKPKAPYWSWKEYQTNRMPIEKTESVFSITGCALACAAGPVSGNLEILDFDNPELFPEWLSYLETINLDLKNKLTIITTPSGGFHVPYRVEGADVSGNKKLAMDVDKKDTWIETRGNGGYVLVPPSEGYVGGYNLTPTITTQERNELLNLCRSFDQRKPEEDKHNSVYRNQSDTQKPGDLFNELYSNDIAGAVIRAGWKESFTANDGNRHFIRPGKKTGTSATLKDDIFYVWSSNAGLPVGGHSAFSVYSWLLHNGDYSRAAAELLKSGCLPGYDQEQATMQEPVTAVPEAIEKEKLKDFELASIDLDCLIDDAGYMINTGITGLTSCGLPKINQFAFPVVVSAISRAIGNKITLDGTYCNLFCIKVGGTSTGKTLSDSAFFKAMNEKGHRAFFGLSDIASGPALYRSFEGDNAEILAVFDEVTELFKQHGNGDPVAAGKRAAMLEIFSKAGGFISKNFGSSKNNIDITCPFFTMTGNATPLIFNELTETDLESGLLQRFDFFYHGGGIPERAKREKENLKLEEFCDLIIAVKDVNPLAEISGVTTEVGLTPDAETLLADYSKKTDIKVGQCHSEGERGLVSRRYDLAKKYALIHMVSSRVPAAIMEPCDRESMKWGIEVANLITNWKRDSFIVKNTITYGETDRLAKKFIAAIVACHNRGIEKPTFKQLVDRRRAINNQGRLMEMIIKNAIRSGQIGTEEIRGKTRYFIAKQEDV